MTNEQLNGPDETDAASPSAARDAAAASPTGAAADDRATDAAAAAWADATTDATADPAAAPAHDVTTHPATVDRDATTDRDVTTDAATDGSSRVGDARPAAASDSAGAVQYGVGPFSLREVILAGVWLVAFIVSFFSTSFYTFSSVWTQGIDWVLAIGVPTVAVFLLILRRLSPSGIRRVGSLGIDQFASVAFSVAAVVWLGQVWWQVGLTAAGGRWVLGWVPWVELVLMLAGVVLTVFAGLIPGLKEDFEQRPETVSHRVARTVRPVTPRPVTPRPAAPHDAPASAASHDGHGATTAAPAGATAAWPTAASDEQPVADHRGFAPEANDQPTEAYEDLDATRHQEQQPLDERAPASAHQAFWALVPEERDVVDENGAPLFRIGPTAWALVIEDRGSSFVVRHEDGRVGYLTDVSGVTRG